MSFPATDFLTDNARTQGEVKSSLEDWLAATKLALGADGGAWETLSIAAGAATPSGVLVAVDTEGALGADNLDALTPTNLNPGAVVILRAVSAARVVTVRHAQGGTGAIHLQAGANIVLSDPSIWLTLVRVGDDWHELGRRYGTAQAQRRADFGDDAAYLSDALGGTMIDVTGPVDGVVTVDHADTSEQADVVDTAGTAVTGLALDGAGHVTGVDTQNFDDRYATRGDFYGFHLIIQGGSL